MTSSTTPVPQRNHHAMRAQRLLEHIASRAPYGCRLPELAEVEFGFAHHVSDGALSRLVNSLNRLTREGCLTMRGDGPTQCWYSAAQQEAPRSSVVPPRQVQVMAGHYTPVSWQPARAGAQEHLGAPSRRGDERLAHRGGYVQG
ncbi:MAG: hypothetical protein K2Y10_00375 [Burkholderiaceae bacterium]|nr:hypothetical protein [Burkholderiaceae bacterium]MBY0454742.1 hypothetical protein [Burkholderiaceae bacterium]